MSRIVLVNPPLTTEERYGVHFRSGGMTPPLGLACLASILMNHSIGVRIVDGALANDYRVIVDDILRSKPDYVGITASTVSIYNASKLASMIKDKNSNIIIFIGGAHLTALPVDTMKRFGSFDIGVIGEADYTLTELIDTLETKGDLSLVNGIIYRGEELIQTAKRAFTINLDDLPMPAWELLPDIARTYCPPVHTVKRLPAALLVTSRGCPAKCKFCDRSIFGNNIRANSANYVMKMMRQLYYKYGIREFQFRDDNFLAFRPRLVELCHLLENSNLDIVFSIAGRIDMVNPEILSLLAKAGCWQIWYGVESGSQRILDFINKKTTLEKIKNAVDMTKKAGIDACGFFMIGLPIETPDDIKATIKFSRSLALSEAHFTFFTPLPGCELYETVRQYGAFDDDWHKASCWNPVFIPDGMTEKQLVHYWKRASLGFYLRPRIILNYIKKIRSFSHIKIYLLGVFSLFEAIFIKKYNKVVQSD